MFELYDAKIPKPQQNIKTLGDLSNSIAQL